MSKKKWQKKTKETFGCVLYEHNMSQSTCLVHCFSVLFKPHHHLPSFVWMYPSFIPILFKLLQSQHSFIPTSFFHYLHHTAVPKVTHCCCSVLMLINLFWEEKNVFLSKLICRILNIFVVHFIQLFISLNVSKKYETEVIVWSLVSVLKMTAQVHRLRRCVWDNGQNGCITLYFSFDLR